MRMLGIETSCDETSVAVVQDGRHQLSCAVRTQIDIHRLYGGVVPEIASRAHVESIGRLTQMALDSAGLTLADIDGIAVTAWPGLIGALLVGVDFAKGLSLATGVPLTPVHHLRGHVAANYLAYPELSPPFLALIVSGGHTSLVHVTGYTEFRTLGRTRDDAAGECFDKVARVLGLPYPGGVAMDALAQTGRAGTVAFPAQRCAARRSTSVFRASRPPPSTSCTTRSKKGRIFAGPILPPHSVDSVAQALTGRLEEAARQVQATALVLAGGVSANSVLRRRALETAQKLDLPLYLPPLSLCGDNAAMIAAQGFFELSAGHIAPSSLNALATREIEDNEI